MQIEPGSRVLVWARVTNDGRGVIVAPGAELGANVVEVATDVPDFGPEPPAMLMLFFASDAERDDTAARMQDICPLAEPKAVSYGDA